MNNFKVWLFAIVVTTVGVVALGSVLLVSIANAPGSTAPSPSPTTTVTSQPITVTGNLTCLPHRSQNGMSTMECAYGLKAGDVYYGLGGLTQEALTASMETTVRVTGTLNTSTPDPVYGTAGTITVTKFEKL